MVVSIGPSKQTPFGGSTKKVTGQVKNMVLTSRVSGLDSLFEVGPLWWQTKGLDFLLPIHSGVIEKPTTCSRKTGKPGRKALWRPDQDYTLAFFCLVIPALWFLHL